MWLLLVMGRRMLLNTTRRTVKQRLTGRLAARLRRHGYAIVLDTSPYRLRQEIQAGRALNTDDVIAFPFNLVATLVREPIGVVGKHE